jgi:hypothetical protein
MRRISPTFFNVLCLVIVAFSLTALAVSQNSSGERYTVLTALRVLYGKPLNGKLEFSITPKYVLRPIFSAQGSLVRVSAEPRSIGEEVAPIPRSEWDSILAKLNTIKPLGDFEEEFGAMFISGGRAQGEQRYQNGYVGMRIVVLPPHPVVSASIYYIHSVTGVPRLPSGSKPQDAAPFNFGLVCIGEDAYIAPDDEFRKIWAKPGVEQTLLLAGPTKDRCQVAN